MLSGARSGNYTVAVEPAKGSIEPKVVKLEWRGVSGLVYDGNRKSVNATAHELIPGDECEVAVTNGDKICADTYTAAAALKNNNYKLPEDDTVTQVYTIAPAPLYIPEQTVSYNGTCILRAMLPARKPQL